MLRLTVVKSIDRDCQVNKKWEQFRQKKSLRILSEMHITNTVSILPIKTRNERAAFLSAYLAGNHTS